MRFIPNHRSFFKIASHGRVLLCVSTFCISVLSAAPTGGVVTNGNAQIIKNGVITDINQQSQKASINWQGFGIAPSETVNFNQPNSNALTLNRVIGNERSVIEGVLNANGKVFIINSNGVLFTKGSSVNTAGLVASTLDISDENFNGNNFVFNSAISSENSVINLGTIKVADGGYIALLGEKVANEGVLVANKGTVALNSGDKITLNFNGNSLVGVAIDEGALNALVENKGAITANGGQVILTAKAANELIKSQVNVKGLVEAKTLDDLKGDININAYGGTATIDGTLDASALNGDGGFIETSGDKVTVTDDALITTRSNNGKTGTWLIDPKDFTVGANGDISGQTLSTQLQNSNIEIQSQNGAKEGKGDINVNDAVTWNADTTLTLSAENDIYI